MLSGTTFIFNNDGFRPVSCYSTAAGIEEGKLLDPFSIEHHAPDAA